MKKIVFVSYPDLCDNSFAIFYEILKQKKSFKCVWLLSSKENKNVSLKLQRYFTNRELLNVKFIKKNSFRGLWHNLTAKYIINTHGCFEQFPILRGQKKINLWHGMPLKNIAALDKGVCNMKMNKTVSSSPLFRDIIAKSFMLDEEQVLPIGLPRNDFFFKDNSDLKKELNIRNNQEIYIWMPTYRQSAEGDIRLDGDSKYQIGGISQEQYKTLNKQLIAENKMLYIKLHPMDVLNQKEHNFNFSNIKVMKNTDFLKIGCEVNHFLSIADVLITDYSSVYFDFALLNRPIILYVDDQESYKNSRGFTSDKLLDVMSESLTISTSEELIKVLAQPIENLPVISGEANNIINQYTLEILGQKKTLTDAVIKAIQL